jgi:hypothetical protein
MTLIEKFLLVFVSVTMINTAVWEKCVAANLYDCVDEAIPGYWEPGFWVHPYDGHLVRTVPQVTHDHSMSDPDTIKQGWTISRLLALWSAFFSASHIASLAVARLPWTRREWSNRALQPTASPSDV